MLFGSTPPFTVLVFTPLPRHCFKKKLCRQIMVCIFSNKVFISYRLWTSLVSQTVKNLSAMQETQVQPLCQGRFRGEKNGYPLHDSCLENFINRGELQSKGLLIHSDEYYVQYVGCFLEIMSLNQTQVCSPAARRGPLMAPGWWCGRGEH